MSASCLLLKWSVFNLLNHPNYGGYDTALNLGSFGTPTQNGSDAYVPREFQFSFHFQFFRVCILNPVGRLPLQRLAAPHLVFTSNS